MESTRDIKGRIKSVTNIQQITKAMKMVAAARLRKAEEKARGSRPFAEIVEELLRRIFTAAPELESPLSSKREVKKTGYLVICGDKGLAGAYSSNVMKEVMTQISGKDPSSYNLYVCGKQAKNYLKFRGFETASYHSGFSDKPSSLDAQEEAREMMDAFEKGEVDEVYVVYTKFYTALRQKTETIKILPIEPPEDKETQNKPAEEYMFLPDAAAVFEQLLPKYVQVQIYNAMLQSAASELGSRMAAMSAATDNAKERIDDLTLSYNKARQALVTREISEIVGGAAALE